MTRGPWNCPASGLSTLSLSRLSSTHDETDPSQISPGQRNCIERYAIPFHPPLFSCIPFPVPGPRKLSRDNVELRRGNERDADTQNHALEIFRYPEQKCEGLSSKLGAEGRDGVPFDSSRVGVGVGNDSKQSVVTTRSPEFFGSLEDPFPSFPARPIGQP